MKIGDRRFGDHQPVGIDAEIVVAGDDAGKAVHDDPVAVLGRDVEHDPPPLAFDVTGPVVVGDHDVVVLGVTAGGHEGAAMIETVRSGSRLLFLVVRVVPGHVVPGQFHEGVQRHHVVQVDRHYPVRPQALDDSLQLGLVFGVDFRPEHVVGRFAEKRPVLVRIVRILQLHRLERILDFRRQQIAVLEANLVG